jgi:hypothetical protein
MERGKRQGKKDREGRKLLNKSKQNKTKQNKT